MDNVIIVEQNNDWNHILCDIDKTIWQWISSFRKDRVRPSSICLKSARICSRIMLENYVREFELLEENLT